MGCGSHRFHFDGGLGSHRSHGSHGNNFCWWEISQNYVGRSHTDSTDSTKIIIREIRGIRVFFNLPQIITNFHKFKIPTNSSPRRICGNLVNRSTRSTRSNLTLQLPPASVRFNTLKSKTCGICEICVSLKQGC